MEEMSHFNMPAHFEPHNILILSKEACKKHMFVTQTWQKVRRSQKWRHWNIFALLCCILLTPAIQLTFYLPVFDEFRKIMLWWKFYYHTKVTSKTHKLTRDGSIAQQEKSTECLISTESLCNSKLNCNPEHLYRKPKKMPHAVKGQYDLSVLERDGEQSWRAIFLAFSSISSVCSYC